MAAAAAAAADTFSSCPFLLPSPVTANSIITLITCLLFDPTIFFNNFLINTLARRRKGRKLLAQVCAVHASSEKENEADRQTNETDEK